LALSNPVSRSTFFLGKITGIFLTLVPILVICFIAILLIIQFSPVVQFSISDYGRIGVLLLSCLIYFAFFVFVGGFISSIAKSSTASVIINLFIWCFLLFLLPHAASYIGKTISPIDDYKQVKFNTYQIDEHYLNVEREKIEKTLENENLKQVGINGTSNKWNGATIVMFTPRPTMEYERRKKELSTPVLMENCDKKWAIQSEYLQQVCRQEQTVRYFSCLSPAGILRYIAASLCRTGINSELHFMSQARQFHDVFFGYFVQNKLFSSYEYFTMQKESEFPNDWDEAREQKKKWETEAKPEGRNDYRSFAPVNTQSFPHFTCVQPTLGDDLYEQIYLVAGIIVTCILLFWLSFMAFIKYDIR
jgi:ABC-type transport system involved in multi-copper enzyme maturation permease subunit